MKKLLLFAIILFYACNLFAFEKKVTLSYGEYPPYYGKNLKNNGPMTEIIVKAYDQVGYKVKLIYINVWKRRFVYSKIGKYDGMFTMWHKKEREEFFLFSDTLPKNKIVFYKRKETDFNKDNLEQYKIGIIRGFARPSGYENLKYEEVARAEQNIAKLIFKRIDLAIIDQNVGQNLLKTEFKKNEKQIIYIHPPIEEINQYLVISKKAENYEKPWAMS